MQLPVVLSLICTCNMSLMDKAHACKVTNGTSHQRHAKLSQHVAHPTSPAPTAHSPPLLTHFSPVLPPPASLRRVLSPTAVPSPHDVVGGPCPVVMPSTLLRPRACVHAQKQPEARFVSRVKSRVACPIHSRVPKTRPYARC